MVLTFPYRSFTQCPWYRGGHGHLYTWIADLPCAWPSSSAAMRSHQEIYFFKQTCFKLFVSSSESPLSLLSSSRGDDCNTFFCCHVRLHLLLSFPPIFQPLLVCFCLLWAHQFSRSFLDSLASISCRGFNLILCWYLWQPGATIHCLSYAPCCQHLQMQPPPWI